MKLILISLVALVVLLALGCGAAEPTPNIDATVEARAKELVAVQPTTTPVVFVKEVAPTDTPFASKSPAVGGEDHTNRRVGNKVGDISPDFSILLTTGEPLYSSTIRSDRIPVFLFFFSPS